jgi:hypothetical protein
VLLIAFGGAPAAAQGSARGVSVRFSMESAFESVRQASGTAGSDDGAARFRAELRHQRTSRRSSLRFWGGATADQLLATRSARSLAAAFTVDSTVTLSRRSRLDVAQRLSSTPLDLFTSLGSGAPAAASQTVTSGSELKGFRTLTQDARAALTRTLSDKSVATFAGTFTVSAGARERVTSSGASARLTRRVGAFGGWHAGYGFTAATFGGPAARELQQRHDLDIGVDFARPLPFSRRTTFSVSTGSSWLVQDAQRQMRTNATAGVEHRLARRWTSRADYSRPIQFLAGFREPLLSDALRVGIEGRLPGRVSLSIIAGGARGAVGLGGGARFESYTGSVRVTRRLGPEWDMEVEYHDARYRFAGQVSSSGAIPAAFARRGGRVGFVWAPVWVR